MEKLAQDKFKDTQLNQRIKLHMNYVPIFELENPQPVFLVNL